MAGLKELRTRIESIKSTHKITAAMKMVSASKFRRAQLTLDKSESFQDMLLANIKKVLAELKMQEAERHIQFVMPKLLIQPTNPQVYALFVLASDKGLCGSYNSMIAKEAKRRIDELTEEGKKVLVFCYGKKALSSLNRYGVRNIAGAYSNVIKKHLTYAEALSFLRDVWDKKNQYQVDVCEIVYSDFLSGLSKTYLSKQVIPLDIHLAEEEQQLNRIGSAFYEYLPDPWETLHQFLNLYVRTSMFEILINSQASEHVARMTSMDNATRNAQDMIKSLTFKYNSLRQSAITTELVEIVAGAEAM
ncbi:MAG: ATP synthase F1 subunit gamma [Alphaproteobacteria bacterium]|nr:ATP synthase F1 subunit gamma [Alphaproteobacteria bacterium]